jgi:hypothetical protein
MKLMEIKKQSWIGNQVVISDIVLRRGARGVAVAVALDVVQLNRRLHHHVVSVRAAQVIPEVSFVLCK